LNLHTSREDHVSKPNLVGIRIKDNTHSRINYYNEKTVTLSRSVIWDIAIIPNQVVEIKKTAFTLFLVYLFPGEG
jgi:hypothetical protein